MKPNRQKSVAMIAVALFGGVAGLTGIAIPSAFAACTVTLVVTDANGNPDSTVEPRKQPCRSGEKDGGTEWYNPYTGTYRFYPPSGHPFSGSDAGPTPSSSSGSTPRTGGQGSSTTTGGSQTGTSSTHQTTGGGSTAPKGPKGTHPTTQTTPSSSGALK